MLPARRSLPSLRLRARRRHPPHRPHAALAAHLGGASEPHFGHRPVRLSCETHLALHTPAEQFGVRAQPRQLRQFHSEIERSRPAGQPVDVERLKAILRRTMHDEEDAVIRTGELTMDQDTHEVSVGDEQVEQDAETGAGGHLRSLTDAARNATTRAVTGSVRRRT